VQIFQQIGVSLFQVFERQVELLLGEFGVAGVARVAAGVVGRVGDRSGPIAALRDVRSATGVARVLAIGAGRAVGGIVGGRAGAVGGFRGGGIRVLLAGFRRLGLRTVAGLVARLAGGAIGRFVVAGFVTSFAFALALGRARAFFRGGVVAGAAGAGLARALTGSFFAAAGTISALTARGIRFVRTAAG
jgi:hypothetical protein